MTLPVITIIIPVYNVAPYILKCLESVSNQTYKGGIECLIVDDCGQDNSIQLAKDFVYDFNLKKSKCSTLCNISFLIINREKNGGLSVARNVGIKASTGDYLFFLDSDDWLENDCLEKLVGLLSDNTDLVFGSAYNVSDGKKTFPDWLKCHRDELKKLKNDHSMIMRVLLGMRLTPIPAWNKLIRKNFIIENKVFFLEGIIHEDVLYNYHLARHAQSIKFCYEPTYNYLNRSDSIISNLRAGKKQLSDISMLRIANVILDDLDTSEYVHEQLLIPIKIAYQRYMNSWDRPIFDESKKILLKCLRYASFMERICIIGVLLFSSRTKIDCPYLHRIFLQKCFKIKDLVQLM